MKRLILLALGVGIAASAYSINYTTPEVSAAETIKKLDVAIYNDEGGLKVPDDLETWVFMGMSIGMTYFDDKPDPEDPGLSSTVLLEPNAFQVFLETGEFPEGTVFAKVVRETVISDGGYSLGDELGIEFHVKDRKRFPKHGFNFFFVQSGNDYAPKMPQDNACVACHLKTAAFDNFFTQFYPPIRSRLKNAED